ncbi:hypothetical protein FH972_022367 [Carpinus fangiana]|uniref:Sensitive to high expression protein 9, mitochondrial n=1 Tax=Carpinus fangiana TaxID=176857 RepID=A0A5N6KSF2_9ROSI|nr:hypothetical protein FH972_022367 [Carpinus fangiana]
MQAQRRGAEERGAARRQRDRRDCDFPAAGGVARGLGAQGARDDLVPVADADDAYARLGEDGLREGDEFLGPGVGAEGVVFWGVGVGWVSLVGLGRRAGGGCWWGGDSAWVGGLAMIDGGESGSESIVIFRAGSIDGAWMGRLIKGLSGRKGDSLLPVMSMASISSRLGYSIAVTTSQEDNSRFFCASQKEVVQLLERKQSWSAADLERYMSLIRSEHINEQGVSAAREELERCEATLEVARQKVEQAERKQYHEEQIWSDTIRRNSTWVTFGLMGLNILLLIVNLVMIEPWRRKRMVKEIRTALDEKTFAANTAVAVGGEAMGETDQELSQAEPSTDEVLKEVVAAHATKGGEIALSTDVDAIQTEADGEGTPRRFRDRILGTVNSWFQDAWEWANFMLSEEHHIIISRVDLTTAVAEAWAIGATCMLLLFVTVPIDLSDVFR